jgi:hypothetical protein
MKRKVDFDKEREQRYTEIARGYQEMGGLNLTLAEEILPAENESWSLTLGGLMPISGAKSLQKE